ncbi:MAG TPA: hypothetical protein VMU30_07465 [Bacteroidota bacterium]|nr:hypothetical protein [Bacteroidota bacterium]
MIALRKKNVLIKTSGKLFIPVVFLCCCVVFGSCNTPVEYKNPFDPSIQIDPPSDLVIDSMSETSVTLSWKNNFNVSSQEQLSKIRTVIFYAYQPFYGYNNNIYNIEYIFIPVDTVSGSIHTATINRVFEPSTFHAFAVYTLAGKDTSLYSNVVTTTNYTGSLSPSSLNATYVNAASCKLQWQDNSTSERSFVIERKNSGDTSFTRIAQVPANTTTFVDTTIRYHGDTVYYRVYADFGNGLLSPSCNAYEYVPLVAPTLSNSLVSKNLYVSLFWKNNVTYGDGFIIERAQKGSNFNEIQRISISDTAYIDQSPDTTIEYIYRVKLFAGTHVSDPSNSIDLVFGPKATLNNTYSGDYGTMSASPDHSLIALTGDMNGTITIMNSSTMQTVKQFQNSDIVASSVDISSDNQFVAAGFTDNTNNTGMIKIWRLSDGSLYKGWNRPNPVSSVRFSPDGLFIAADGDTGKTINFDVNDGLYLPGSMSIIDIKTDTVVHTLSGNKIVFAPNQLKVASIGSGQVLVWSLPDGSPWSTFSYTFFSQTSSPTQMKFFNSGIQVAIAIQNFILLWNIQQNSSTSIQFTEHPVDNFSSIIQDIDLSSDNNYMCIYSARFLYIKNMVSWTNISALNIGSGINALLYLSNNRIIAAGYRGINDFYLTKQWTTPVP